MIVEFWLRNAPKEHVPLRLELSDTPREGELIVTPWCAAARVRTVQWNIQPSGAIVRVYA